MYLDHEKIDGSEIGENITADIYKVDKDGTATRLASGSIAAVKDSTSNTIECNPIVGSQDFEKGERLALRISWNCTIDELRIHYYRPDKKHYSNLTSPSSDPGYPTSEIPIPEFATIATPIAIVLGLMFLYYRRKEKG